MYKTLYEQKTSIESKTTDPQWFCGFSLKNNPDQDYINETEFIEFIVYNHKKLFKDEVIGYYCISMDDLRRVY